MTSIAELRKEKQLLVSHINKCRYYNLLVREKLSEIGREYRKGKLSREDYHNKLNYGLEGKSFRYYTTLYGNLVKKYEKRIKEIDNEIKKKGRNKGAAISAILLVLLLSSLFMFNQTDITGKVVFSMVESNSDVLDMEFSESRSFTWIPVNRGRLNTISLTGEYLGEGGLRIYLDLEEESRLIYATESSSSFESECGNACYLYDTSQEEYIIRVELPKESSLTLERIDYLVSELEEFKISPSNLTINLTENRFIKNKFNIYNSRNKNFSVALYVEGDLAEYTTLYSSYEEFNDNDTVKQVSYDIDLPLKIEPGIYSEKIIVRYLPKGEFKGEAPTEEHEIVVNVGMSERQLLAPSKVNYVYVMIVLLVLVMLVNLAIFIRKKR